MEALEYPILALSEVMSQNDQQKLLMGHGKLLYQLELHLNQTNERPKKWHGEGTYI